MNSNSNLQGKVAFVTGGARGIGAAVVRRLASEGATVAFTYNSSAASANDLIASIEKAGGRAVAVKADVADPAALTNAINETAREFGKVDILVNNAGMSPGVSGSMAMSQDLFDKVVSLNFKGPYRLSALVGSRMAAGAGGSIINVSSIGSLIPRASYGPYAGAKAALNAITVAHAQEFGPKVRVNVILPGSFRTDISKAWPPEKEAEMQAAIPRYGEPAEIVTTALYLASDHSSYTTGAMIRVDGGRRE